MSACQTTTSRIASLALLFALAAAAAYAQPPKQQQSRSPQQQQTQRPQQTPPRQVQYPNQTPPRQVQYPKQTQQPRQTQQPTQQPRQTQQPKKQTQQPTQQPRQTQQPKAPASLNAPKGVKGGPVSTKQYPLEYGVKLKGGGYAYKGIGHRHWTRKFYCGRWRTWCWYCPATAGWFYWADGRGLYLPVRYLTVVAPTTMAFDESSEDLTPPGAGEIDVADSDEIELPEPSSR